MISIHAANNALKVFTDTYQYLEKSKSENERIEDLKMAWAKQILRRLGVELHIIGRPTYDSSVLFLGNHISYIDIPLLMSTTPDISFVAKEELSKWPVFGAAARRIETVFVKREQGSSRKSARLALARALEAEARVVVFPSGTTSLTECKPWRWGAFQVAHEANSYVQPFRISYSPLRTAAYIDQDFFPLHLYNLSRQQKIQATIEFHEPVKIIDPTADCQQWQNWSKEKIKL